MCVGERGERGIYFSVLNGIFHPTKERKFRENNTEARHANFPVGNDTINPICTKRELEKGLVREATQKSLMLGSAREVSTYYLHKYIVL